MGEDRIERETLIAAPLELDALKARAEEPST